MSKEYIHIDTAQSFSSEDQEKVIFVIQSLTRGGAENFFVTLVNKLKQLGVEPVVIILSDHNPLLDQLDASIKRYVLNRNFRYDVFISTRIRKIILEEKAKKVFCIGAFTFFLTKLSVFRNRNFTFYLSLHTTVPVSLKAHVLDMLYLKFLGKFDETIFICKSQKLYYEQHYAFKPKKASIIYNGIDNEYAASYDTKAVELAHERIRQELNIPADASIILKVANIRKEKGHTYAVDALNFLHKKFNNKAHLVFVGNGPPPYREKLLLHIKESSLASHIHMVGDKSDVRPYLAASSIFTLTSYSVETFSIAALEAMCFGLPCCLTEIGGASEMVETNRNGMLCQPKDIASIAHAWNQALTNNFDKHYIRKLVSTKFSSDKMAENYLAVLQQTHACKMVNS